MDLTAPGPTRAPDDADEPKVSRLRFARLGHNLRIVFDGGAFRPSVPEYSCLRAQDRRARRACRHDDRPAGCTRYQASSGNSSGRRAGNPLISGWIHLFRAIHRSRYHLRSHLQLTAPERPRRSDQLCIPASTSTPFTDEGGPTSPTFIATARSATRTRFSASTTRRDVARGRKSR